MLTLKNCRFLPELVESYDGCQGDLVLDGGKIVSILPAGTAPQTGDVLDLQGKTVLPGLFDLHVHLTLSGGDTLIDNAKSPVEMALDAVKFAQDTLYAGFTTIRDVGSCHNVAIALRYSIQSGKLVGPNILASGKILTPTEAGNDFFQGLYVECDTPDEIKKAVRGEMKQGADFIKIMGTGAVMNPGGEPGQPIYSYEELKAVVDAAAFKGTYVATHCHGTRAIKDSIRAGVRTIEHASLMDDECIELLLAHRDTSYIVPTLNILMHMLDGVPESSTFFVEKARTVLNGVRTGVRKAYEAGLTIGFGTDQGGCPVRHGDNADEFLHRRDFLGMKEIDILKQATVYSARIAGVEDRLGTLKPGKEADVIAVDGDPLTDLSVMRDKVCLVIRGGDVVRQTL